MFEWIAAFAMCFFFFSLKQKHRLRANCLALTFYYLNLAWLLVWALACLVIWSSGFEETLKDPALLASSFKRLCLDHRDSCLPIIQQGVAVGALIMHKGRDMALYCCNLLNMHCTAEMLLTMADAAVQ